jgi:acyl dehydratase
MIRGFLEDHVVGSRTVTHGRTITEADVVGFAGLSGDWHPVHTIADYARKGPFGERIAHGMLVLSIATGLVDIDNETGVAFYGIDRLRFVQPTRLGDTIHVVSEVAAVEPRDATSGVVTTQIRVENEREELLVAATFRILVRRQPEHVSDRAVDRGEFVAVTVPEPDGVG